MQEPGAFVMPIGPKFSGVTESVHFLLETVGEDVIRSTPRLFYKWRAVEKLAEGKTADEVLLARGAVRGHDGLCSRAGFLSGGRNDWRREGAAARGPCVCFWRNLNACASTPARSRKSANPRRWSSPTARPEFWRRNCCAFPANSPAIAICSACSRSAGCCATCQTDACRQALEKSQRVLTQLNELEQRLRISSSFLDRIEEVGIVPQRTAKVYGLVGPVARASGIVRDLRRAQPYLGYENFEFDVPVEQEGDGYARLRMLFAEARQSVRIMEQAVAALQSGGCSRTDSISRGRGVGLGRSPARRRRSIGCGWTRAAGSRVIASFTPSFTNWHGFHLAAEKFAFQDFPIILSTFDLSVAENDR